MGRRTAAIYFTVIVLFTGVLCRIYALSMGESLASVAHTQSSYLLDVDNTRGIIYDCNLRPLVGTERRSVAAIQPSPEAFTALTQAAQETGESFEINGKNTKPYLIEPEETAVYAKGVEMFDAVKRYGSWQLAPHIIGYLNPSKTDGAAGIEMAYNAYLKQHSGSLRLRYRLDALGRAMPSQSPEILMDNYQDKGGVALTLDADIQRAAERAMQDIEKGAAVVMDVNTGDIKASVSVPAYDPNDLAASLKNPASPFVNRAFSQYNVGSTFKLVTAAAALENGFGRYTPYVCNGYIDVDGHRFNCHWRTGHGQLDLEGAIEVSCNPFFIHLGLQTGGKRIASLARDMGFGKAAVFSEDIRTQSGTMPRDDELEIPAAVANFSFGQGRLTATPIQIAQMISTIANGGYAVTPRLVEGFTEDGEIINQHTTIYAPNQVINERTSRVLREALLSNVLKGSGKEAKPMKGDAGGKTASAQTGIYQSDGETEIVHAWFAGYYPADTPLYAIVVLVEGGDSGSDVAAPVFKEIADGIYLSKL